MTRLLYITNGIYGPGGLERVLSIKASYLADILGYEVHILTLNQGQQPVFYQFSNNITFHDITAQGNPMAYLLNYRRGIKQILNKVKPQVVLVCDDGLKGLLLPFFIKKTCPMVYERHVSKNIELKSDNPSRIEKGIFALKQKLMDLGARQYDAFVVLTQGNAKEWETNNIQVIPNPLSFYPKDLSGLNNKRVIAVGKQSYQKGYDRLLQAWKTVNNQHPDWQLEIYGTINKSERLEELANDLDIAKSVNFHEPVKNIGDKYKEASVYVMSSRYEGFGMVLTEAMAYGVPCISFDCPHGPADIINDGEDGFLVPNGNIKGLSNAMAKLIGDSELRLFMGKKARKNVLRYLPQNIMLKWDKLFKQLLDTKTP